MYSPGYLLLTLTDRPLPLTVKAGRNSSVFIVVSLLDTDHSILSPSCILQPAGPGLTVSVHGLGCDTSHTMGLSPNMTVLAGEPGAGEGELSASVTSTAQVAVSPPASAVIVAVPLPTALTVPSLSTVATLVLLEVHVTVAVLSGVTVAVSFSLSPIFNLRLVLSSVIPESGLSAFSLMVKLQVAFTSLVVGLPGSLLSGQLAVTLIVAGLVVALSPAVTFVVLASAEPNVTISAVKHSHLYATVTVSAGPFSSLAVNSSDAPTSSSNGPLGAIVSVGSVSAAHTGAARDSAMASARTNAPKRRFL